MSFLLNPYIFSAVSAYGTYELLADTTVNGSAVTSVNLAGLNIGKSDEIVLVSDFNNTTTTSYYHLFFNNNTTDANYFSQELYADSTSIGSARSNSARAFLASANHKTFCVSAIKLTNSGYVVAQNASNRDYDYSGILQEIFYSTSTFTTASITQITINATVANAIGIGSRFQLYRIAGA